MRGPTREFRGSSTGIAIGCRPIRTQGVDDDQRDAVEALTKSIVNKILHAPVSKLRREAEHEEGIVYLEAARALFGLDDETSDEE